MTVAVPAGFTDLLDRPLLAHLATVRPGGRPHVTPMWFLWDGIHLCFTSTTTRQKNRNIQVQPAVSVSISDPAIVYRHLEIDGLVERVEADPAGQVWRRMADRYGEPADRVPHDVAQRVAYFVRPTRISAFARRPSWRSLPRSEED